MSFSLIAEVPEKKEISIFNRSAWIWHPLWEYVEKYHPSFGSKVKYGHSNDADGLDGELSKSLGLELEKDLESGIAQERIDKFNSFLDSLEDVTCPRCLGFGLTRIGIMRTSEANCIKCEGSGKSRPAVCSYFMRIGDLSEFANFLVHCGGFKIH